MAIIHTRTDPHARTYKTAQEREENRLILWSVLILLTLAVVGYIVYVAYFNADARPMIESQYVEQQSIPVTSAQ